MKTKLYLVFILFSFPFIMLGQTKRINFTAPIFYPEGVAYDAPAKNFFISSVTTGTIGKVDLNGNFSSFYQDSSLKSSYGMKIDSARNTLWVCSGDANYSKYADTNTYKKMIRLIGLDLNTGTKTNDIDLSNVFMGKHFANDLTLDDKGNIYITDSYSPVIYKIDRQMKPSVFAKSEWFRAVDVGLNGIVWNAEGYLLTVNNSDGCLYKIETENPQNITRVKLNTFFPGADGLMWDRSKNLVLIQNKGVHKVFQLASSDKWQSARIIGSTLTADRFDQPTTGTLKGNEIHVLNSQMNDLTDPTAPPAKEFSLQLVRFLPHP